MDEERDIVVFEDDAGNEIKMEVIDYLAYEGKEYALLIPLIEDEDEIDEDADGTDEDELPEAFVMEVVDAGDDMEEFVPVEDEELAAQLIEIFQSYDLDELYDEEDEEE